MMKRMGLFDTVKERLREPTPLEMVSRELAQAHMRSLKPRRRWTTRNRSWTTTMCVSLDSTRICEPTRMRSVRNDML